MNGINNFIKVVAVFQVLALFAINPLSMAYIITQAEPGPLLVLGFIFNLISELCIGIFLFVLVTDALGLGDEGVGDE